MENAGEFGRESVGAEDGLDGASRVGPGRCGADGGLGEPLSRAQSPAAEWVPIERLRGWAQNPRKNSEAVAKVMESIRRWGFGAPLVARAATGELIAGHTRLEAARRLGLTEVPVRFLDLSEDEAHKLAVADNRLAEESAWDKAKLGDLLSSDDWRDDVETIGFDRGEVLRLVGTDDPVELNEIDLTKTRAEFWLTVTGPLPSQPDVLDALRKALASIPGVDVSVSTTEA